MTWAGYAKWFLLTYGSSAPKPPRFWSGWLRYGRDPSLHTGEPVLPAGTAVTSSFLPRPKCSSPSYSGQTSSDAMMPQLRLLLFALWGSGALAHEGFIFHDRESLDVTLGKQCIHSLTAPVKCHPQVESMAELHYRGSLANTTLTDEVCTDECSSSLSEWFNSVERDCAGKVLDGSVPQRLGGFAWAGFNETCLKDPKTGCYCNGISPRDGKWMAGC